MIHLISCLIESHETYHYHSNTFSAHNKTPLLHLYFSWSSPICTTWRRGCFTSWYTHQTVLNWRNPSGKSPRPNALANGAAGSRSCPCNKCNKLNTWYIKLVTCFGWRDCEELTLLAQWRYVIDWDWTFGRESKNNQGWFYSFKSENSVTMLCQGGWGVDRISVHLPWRTIFCITM